ncbi:MAG: multicopper oxidase domain-containing protein, partial [Eubacteriaceae bacterium]|nr:multicopper oxidase domain-containing protein [Eubacteriaceae bacterium]
LPVVLKDLNEDPDIADFQLEAQIGKTEFVNGGSADTLGYNGSYLGPILRIKRGEQVNIQVTNKLNFPTTIHWHGLVVDGEQDGGPHQGIEPGESWNPSFVVDQPAATLWYHPHLMGSSADQVYFGLAGLIYIDDEISDKIDLPKDYGVNDIPLIVQDRSFNSDGSFRYETSMMDVVPGDRVLINGTLEPYLNVDQGKVRFRILNASNSQSFNFRLSDGSGFLQIASDGGFLEKPLSRKSLFLAPGERAEIIVDFSTINRSTLSLMTDDLSILDFNISGKKADGINLPEVLTVVSKIPEGDNPKIRVFELQNMGLNGTINGKYFDMDRIDEEVKVNETELWIIRNLGGMMQGTGHPFHVHGTQFQIVSRDGKVPPLEEGGFKDTVFVESGEEVIIRVRFTHTGIYMYHCHILEHEDNGMMGQFVVQ